MVCGRGYREHKAGCATEQDVTHRNLHRVASQSAADQPSMRVGIERTPPCRDTSPRASEATPELGRATLTKSGGACLPFLLLLYVVAWLDRVNIGFAALQMNADLGFSDDRLRLRRRHLLHRLRAVRGAEQSDPRARRCAVMDRAHHDHVGHLVGRDDVRAGHDQLLRAAVSARRRGSRFPARHHLLPGQLVSGEGPSARAFRGSWSRSRSSTVIGGAARRG